ncbi:hypothetical protein HMPREF1981_03177 [Bacteroides pyogenes F0041]|uniref:Uncharacterized protein n=1 Tax=Bacteroides pyogenes F0041 TaxID=1321819 RepID=U2CBM0_9BACE|nr:hypothetical protein HMPREF1981_03177 [Bacteroides pyogenes F0041]
MPSGAHPVFLRNIDGQSNGEYLDGEVGVSIGSHERLAEPGDRRGVLLRIGRFGVVDRKFEGLKGNGIPDAIQLGLGKADIEGDALAAGSAYDVHFPGTMVYAIGDNGPLVAGGGIVDVGAVDVGAELQVALGAGYGGGDGL